MANGPDGLAISDSRSRINGVVVLPDGIRLPAASDLGIEYPQNGKDQSGSEYDTDQEWHLRSMRYGDGWAHRLQDS